MTIRFETIRKTRTYSTPYKTCSSLRDILTTRHLWLVQLQNLDQTCAPDLPPHVNIDILSCQDLRSLVINAIRSYESLRHGITRYSQRTSFGPLVRGAEIGKIGDNSRLSPGGRYLFIYWQNIKLEIFDLHDNNSCVWVYDKEELHHPKALQYAFEMNMDGTITILIQWKGDSWTPDS